ncbi:MAG: hypothetical protein LBB25_00540 [Holosporaceae bacterium]|jgi:hypothetical protein|nr:hypothetical protein [Holosporaceae bacterium]
MYRKLETPVLTGLMLLLTVTVNGVRPKNNAAVAAVRARAAAVVAPINEGAAERIAAAALPAQAVTDAAWARGRQEFLSGPGVVLVMKDVSAKDAALVANVGVFESAGTQAAFANYSMLLNDEVVKWLGGLLPQKAIADPAQALPALGAGIVEPWMAYLEVLLALVLPDDAGNAAVAGNVTAAQAIAAFHAGRANAAVVNFLANGTPQQLHDDVRAWLNVLVQCPQAELTRDARVLTALNFITGNPYTAGGVGAEIAIRRILQGINMRLERGNDLQPGNGANIGVNRIVGDWLGQAGAAVGM